MTIRVTARSPTQSAPSATGLSTSTSDPVWVQVEYSVARSIERHQRPALSVVRRSHQAMQSTATESAAQISLMRLSANRPRRSTSTATDTLSTESRLTADRRGTGSSMGSRTTSLARPRMVVVQGATSARRSRGIAASRDKTTTGRLPASASSHHHTSPRPGSAVTRRQQLVETRRGRPTRPARRSGVPRTPHSLRRFRRSGDA
jgi:hypothetical protein